MSIWYKLSILCGVTPLVVGLTILLFWLTNRSTWLEVAGFTNIIFGLFSFVCGLVFLLIHVRNACKPTGKKKIFLPVFVLLLNFPAAVFCLSVAIKQSHSGSAVTVKNQTPHEIREFVVDQRGITYSLPLVQPGETHVEGIRFTERGRVRYSLVVGGERFEGNLFEYAAPNKGSHAVVTVEEAGTGRVRVKIF